MPNTQSDKGAIPGRQLTAEEQYFYELSYKEPVESIARIEEMAKFLAGAVTGVSGLFLAAFRLALAGQPAEGMIWYAPVVLWGASLAALMLVLLPGWYATGKNEPAAWQAACKRARWYKYVSLCAGAVLFIAGLVAATIPLVVM